MAEKTTKQKTLEDHYDPMIAYVQTLDPKDKVNPLRMLTDIKCNWGGLYCPYCRKHNSKCPECKLGKVTSFHSVDPLKVISMPGSTHKCCGGLWVKLNACKTWGDWLIAVASVRAFIEEHG